MRVALHCPYSLSRPGGVQGQVTALARALLGAGHRVVVLAPGEAPEAALAAANGLPDGALVVVGRAVPLPANGSQAPVALWPGAAARAWRAVRDGGFDVVHMHEPLAPGAGYGALAGARVPIVGTFHRAGASTAYRALGPLARAGAERLAVRCAVSSEAEATARAALGGDYRIVPNAVELERFAGASAWREPGTVGPVLLFVGRHEERKGLAVLLDAFARVPADADGGPTLWVAGAGPQTEALRGRYPPGERLRWLGAVADDDLRARMAAADVVVAPSLRGESFGVVLVEAMAARAAVVASSLEGYAAVVAGHGTLVPPGDVPALADALRVAVDDARAGQGASAPGALDAAARHAGQWSMQAQAARYAAIYEEALGRGAGPPIHSGP